MRSLQVSWHTDSLQIQRRFYLFCYSTEFQHLHNTLYFKELTKRNQTHLFSNSEAELLSLLLTHQGKSCSQRRCFSHFSGGTKNTEKPPGFLVKVHT